MAHASNSNPANSEPDPTYPTKVISFFRVSQCKFSDLQSGLGDEVYAKFISVQVFPISAGPNKSWLLGGILT